MSERPMLTLARELEAADEAVAAQIAEVDDLQGETARIRERAHSHHDLLAELPAARRVAAESLERAEQALERRRAAVAKVDLELAEIERSRDHEAIAAARRAVVQARDSAGSAERRVARAVEEAERLERDGRSAAAETRALEQSARKLARRIAALPRVSRTGAVEPGPGLDDTIEWASRVQAALFVVRSGLDTERERIIRQANELAAGVLGEPVAPASVTLLRERVEAAVGEAGSRSG
jgi:chromosome segregation ATPase